MLKKNTLYADDILSAMDFLEQQIKGIDNYPEKSLFFQDPQIIEGWLVLVETVKNLKFWKLSEGAEEWMTRTETYAANLLVMRKLYLKYEKLFHVYYDELKKIIEGYRGWLMGDCISAESLDALYAEHDLLGLDDVNLYLQEVNELSHDARKNVFKTLTDIFFILSSVIDSGLKIVMDMNPSIEDFTLAIDSDLREWTIHFGKSMFKRMKEDLHRHFNQRLTDNNRYDLWNEMLRADEKALVMASKQQLASCGDEMQEHWGEDRKALMDENGKLMHLIYSSCYTEELIDLKNVENVQKFIALLTPDNLSMFYEIIVRRNLIQCEMYPELKAQHNEWLNPTKDDETEPKAPVDSEGDVNYDEPAEEERFHFIHVEIEDEEAWRIHRAIKRLVANYRVPEICNYLKEQKQNGKLMLPINPSVMYSELVRLGMPNGEGFSEKNFSNIYNSYMK